MPEKLLSAPKVASLLGIELDTLYRYARKGTVRGFKVGKLWRFAESDVEAFINAKRFGGAGVARDAASSVTLLPELLSHAAGLRGPRPGVIGVAESVTYEELDQLSDRMARALIDRGLGPGDRVLLVLPNCLEFVVSCFAVWKARGVLIADSTAIRTDGLLHVLSDARPKAMILDRGVAERLEGAWASQESLQLVLVKDGAFTLTGREDVDVESLDAVLEADDTGGPRLDWARGKPDDVVSITYTSGSTGLPKGVMHTHESWLAGARFTMEHALIDASDSILIPLPLYHGLAFRQLLAYPLAGAAVLIAADIYMALKWLPQHTPTSMVLVPAACNIILDHFPASLQQAAAHLRYLEIGSAAMSSERLERVRQLMPATVVHLPYGLTEARVGFLERGEGGKLNQFAAVSPGLEVRVADAERSELPLGQSGEIVLKGAGLMKGYWGHNGDSQQRLREHGFRTGDMGRVNSRGRIELLGRLDDVLKIGGKKVIPQEVEQVINRHPGVAECGVVGKADPSGVFETRLEAHVVLWSGASAGADELTEYCRRRLEPHKLPAEFFFRRSLPKSSVGKILRSAL